MENRNIGHAPCAIAAALCFTFAAAASEADDLQDSFKPSVDVALQMRADYTYSDFSNRESESGFHGRYLNLIVNGSILPELTYHLRQRLNKTGNFDNDVFAATDWVYLNYQPFTNFSFAAGKQVLLLGGYEYDAAPIDIFFASKFWNNIACYQFGASATYISPSKNHTLTFQVCNSPYQDLGKSCYAYNLFWTGHMGPFSTLWSTNAIEYERGKYAHFISLGNHLRLGPVALQFDFENRATSRQKYWFSNYTAIAQAEYDVLPWLTAHVKGGHDNFRPLPGAPECQRNDFYGAGLVFYPFKKIGRNLRLHAMWHIDHEEAGTRCSQVNVGLKWHVNVFHSK